MGSRGSAPGGGREAVRRLFAEFDRPSEPVTADEVAARLERPREEVRPSLDDLAGEGELRGKRIDGDTRVWWRPVGASDRDQGDQRPDREEFSAFVSAVEDYAIFMLDPDGVVASWNDGAERIKGYATDEIVGEHFSTFYTGEERDAGVPETNLERAAAQGRVEDEGWRVRKDGSRFWANVVITAVRDDAGDLRGFTKVTRDMTERREFERRLQRERDLTERIVETVPVGIAVIDDDGQFVRANRQLLDLHGIEASALPDYDVTELEVFDGDGEPIPVDDWPWRRVIETGEAVRGFECRIDLPERGRRWVSITAVPLEGGPADDQRVVAAVEDVTARKERERQLHQRKTELETELNEIFGRISDAFFALDDEWRVTHCNDRARELLGRSTEPLLGRPIWDAFSDATAATIRERFRAAMETQEPTSVELYATDLDAWLEFNAYPSESGLSIYFYDVSDRVERERELERYETIVEAIDDGVYVVDDAGRFTMVNEAYAEMLGYERAELLGSQVSMVVDDDVRRRARELQSAMLDGDVDEPVIEAELETATGETVEAEGRFTMLPVADDREYRVGVVRDVTERKHRERELRRTERRFEAIFEDPNILVGLLDPDGTVIDINQTAMEYIDASLEDVTGEPFWETPWWGEGQDVRADVREWTERAAAGEYVEFEADLTRPDGERYTLDGVFRPVTNDEGDVVSLIVSDRDVSERKRRERELEESERRYRTLVEHFPNGAVALVDENLRYQTIGGSPVDVVDVPATSLEGEPVEAAIEPELADELVPRYEAALDGESSAFEIELGGRVYQFQVVPVSDDDDRVFAALGMSQDSTERREYERKLEASNERLEQFAYAASHDLQEPLRMVTSYLQLLEKRYGDDLDDDAREFIDFAVDGAERMREMIDALLEYSRVETRGDPFEAVELDEVLAEVRDDLQLQIAESGADLTVESLPVVEGDPGQLRQVFQNLLDNAIEYSGDEPPRIRVTAERRGSTCEVAVRDEGIGIDPEDADRIFEVFQRLHGHDEHAGTGIGLALCRRIVERHGGEIRVDSEPGEGATFSVTLPLPDEADADGDAE